MKTESIRCDNCKKELSFKENDKIIDDFLMDCAVEINIKGKNGSANGLFCSLICFVFVWNKYQYAKRVDMDLVKDLKLVLPEWQFIPPNYKKIYEDKKLQEIKEILKSISGYELVNKLEKKI